MVLFFKWLELTGEVNCHYLTNEGSDLSFFYPFLELSNSFL